jgi:hypothetical protein
MRGIRVDLDLLADYARQVRAAGEDIAATADRDVHVAPEAFGELGHGAATSYERLRAALLDRRDRAADALTEAADGLRAVVDFHVGDDAGDLRGQEV